MNRRDRLLLSAIAAAVLAGYVTYACVRHVRYRTTGFDLGIFDQVVRAYADLAAPVVPLKAPGYNLLGDHFHPVVALWAPLYWVWADPRMLLAAQAALITASVVPVAAFTARRLSSRAAVVVGTLYLLSWPLQRMVQFDVHEIAFAVPLIAVVIDAVDRRAWRTTALACLVLLGVREDMGLFVLLVGVLVALRSVRLRGPWRPVRGEVLRGAGLAVLGVAGYWFAVHVVIPHFSGGAGFVYWTFPALGEDLPSSVRFMLTHPWSVLVLLVTPWRKAASLIALGMPVLYLCLGSRYLLLAVPFLAQRFLNSRELLWGTNFHYSSVLAPILFLAAVDTLARLLAARPVAARPRLAAGLRRGWLAGCAAVLAGGMLVQAGDYPLSRLWTPRFWAVDARVEAMTAGLALIPSGVCVEAENTAAPHLTARTTVTRVGRSDDLATWMVLDFSRADTGWEGVAPSVAYTAALARGFRPVFSQDVVVVLDRPGAPAGDRCAAVRG